MSTVVSYPSNQYATAALKELRAILTGEVAHLQRELVRTSAALEHVDGVLGIVTPDFAPGTIARRRIAIANPYPLPHAARQVPGTLRRHGAPMHAQEVAEAVAKELGYPPEAAHSLLARVRYALRNGSIGARPKTARIGARRDVRWALA